MDWPAAIAIIYHRPHWQTQMSLESTIKIPTPKQNGSSPTWKPSVSDSHSLCGHLTNADPNKQLCKAFTYVCIYVSLKLDAQLVHRNRCSAGEETARWPQRRQAPQVADHAEIGQVLGIAAEAIPALPVLEALAFLDHPGTGDVVAYIVIGEVWKKTEF